MSTNTGGPAFPFQCEGPNTGPEFYYGMSLRDYFAARAMQGLLAHSGVYSDNREQPPVNSDGWMFKDCAECAYQVADAMLRAREAA